MIATIIISILLLAYALKIFIQGFKNIKIALEGKGCSTCQHKKSPIVQIDFK